jgi:hypothetical protein
MQRFLALPIADPEPSVTEPLPAYVVPAEPEATGEQAPADAPASTTEPR